MRLPEEIHDSGGVEGTFDDWTWEGGISSRFFIEEDKLDSIIKYPLEGGNNHKI